MRLQIEQLRLVTIVLVAPLLNVLLNILINKISEQHPLGIRKELIWWLTILISVTLAFLSLSDAEVYDYKLGYFALALIVIFVFHCLYIWRKYLLSISSKILASSRRKKILFQGTLLISLLVILTIWVFREIDTTKKIRLEKNEASNLRYEKNLDYFAEGVKIKNDEIKYHALKEGIKDLQEIRNVRKSWFVNEYPTTTPIYNLQQITNYLEKSQAVQEQDISEHPLWTLEFSPDGELIATGGWDTKIYLLDKSLKPIDTQQGLEEVITSVSFNSQRDTLAVGTRRSTLQTFHVNQRNKLQLSNVNSWNTDTGQGGILTLSFNPVKNDIIATAGWDGKVRLWNIRSKRRIDEFRNHQDPVRSISFSSDGKILATAGEDGKVFLPELDKFKTFSKYGNTSTQNWIWSINFQPNGKLLGVAGEDGKVGIWNTSSGEFIKKWDTKQGRVTNVRFSSDGEQIATAGWNGTVKLWNLSGKLMGKWNIPSPITSLSFSPKSKQIAAARLDGKVSLWNIKQLDDKELNELINRSCKILNENPNRVQEEDIEKLCPKPNN
ncbi:WD40 repeat domain-containing protein [Mastigocoleus testarum]|uniref:Anaphase-promoting complex subunit 4-like WD40 domain-containing protein n=1 Tax=Mastigocoleus testarum BC008 TaxID=371196 RepID=A0A0V7ZME1_9CYAN|nr:WD40 repeat domain-containing protein [Mastigocoleus testarum]KST65763.1 hypothetical protein BC008_22560 [Mastigocoleus testarum BC008]